MVERKPADESFESWIDKQIREATERGEFDNLAGEGKPLPGSGTPPEEHWWLKDYLRREGLPTEPLLPTPFRLRREIDQLPETVRDLPDEQRVREVVGGLNRRIAQWIRTGSGPPVLVRPVNADRVVEQWRAHRSAPPAQVPDPQHPPESRAALPTFGLRAVAVGLVRRVVRRRGRR